VDSELVELPPFGSDMTDSLQDEKIANQLLTSALCHATYLYSTTDGDIYAYRLCRLSSCFIFVYYLLTVFMPPPACGSFTKIYNSVKLGTMVNSLDFAVKVIAKPNALFWRSREFAVEDHASSSNVICQNFDLKPGNSLCACAVGYKTD